MAILITSHNQFVATRGFFFDGIRA